MGRILNHMDSSSLSALLNLQQRGKTISPSKEEDSILDLILVRTIHVTPLSTVSSTGAQEQGSAGEGSKNSQDDDAGKCVSVFDQLSDEDLALEVILRASKVGKWYTGTREYDTLMKNVVR